MSGNGVSEKNTNELIICRCENVSLDCLKQSIRRSGAATVNQLKKLTRAGMGPCQGRTCAGTVEKVIESEAKIPVGTEPYRSRPPVRCVSITTLADRADQYREPAGPVSVVAFRASDSEEGNQNHKPEEAS